MRALLRVTVDGLLSVCVDVNVCECPPLTLESFIINKCSIVNVEMINRGKKLKSIFRDGVWFFYDIFAL